MKPALPPNMPVMTVAAMAVGASTHMKTPSATVTFRKASA